MSVYWFLEQASKTKSIDELKTVVEDRLAILGFERFALGLVGEETATRNSILLDNLGKGWWKVARGPDPARARQLFIDLLASHDVPFAIPNGIHDEIAARLKAAGHYYCKYPGAIAPAETESGTAYLVALGGNKKEIVDTTMVRLSGIVAIAVLHWRRLSGIGGVNALTPRETEILTLVADGHSSAMIAERLTIAARTVEAHLASAMNKLDARNRTAAVVAAIRSGMIGL